MSRQWYILAIVVFIYLPVSIDATVLHVAIPTLTQDLGLSNNELLWVIDIYSLMMAGLILPMGALGERIGYKKLMLWGAAIFGIGSLMAAFSTSASLLIFARIILAAGAAMILPATLAALRHAFEDEKQRNFALGVWVVAGGGGAAFGPLIGGALLEHYEWGVVFLINIPIIVLVLVAGYFVLPTQQLNTQKKINIFDTALITTSILLMIYALKGMLKQWGWELLVIAVLGIALCIWFILRQRKMPLPLIDLSLFHYRPVQVGFIISIIAMAALVGFELLISQELQFVNGYTPLEAGLFILPFMISISVSGFFISFLLNYMGARKVSIAGMLICATAFAGLAGIDFRLEVYQAAFWMVMLGFAIEATLLSATSAIISAGPAEKATAAGSIEGMSYELGAGFGVAVFGLLASYFYQSRVDFSTWLNEKQIQSAENSIGETIQVITTLEDSAAAAQIREIANQAFMHAHSQVFYLLAVLLFIASLAMTFYWKPAGT